LRLTEGVAEARRKMGTACKKALKQERVEE
jgi:hypothetical protein